MVVTGKVRVYHLDADGREITFETAGAGEPVAAVASLAGARYPANIEAATPVTIAWLEREALFALIGGSVSEGEESAPPSKSVDEVTRDFRSGNALERLRGGPSFATK